jgi:diguanylate cyclase (GGDEF)-like protein
VLSSLEKAQSDIRTKEQQINHISEQAQRDALTSVGNKAAYLHKTEELTARIAEGKAEFAVVMVDMNDLKRINDEYGHRAGDQYIKGCCHIVCQIFKHSPVFRIGGDEFVIILEGDDYQNREVLVALARNTFMQSYLNTDAQQQERYAAAVGMSAYAAGDNSVEAVFRRADDIMYEDKKKFKEAFGTYR